MDCHMEYDLIATQKASQHISPFAKAERWGGRKDYLEAERVRIGRW